SEEAGSEEKSCREEGCSSEKERDQPRGGHGEDRPTYPAAHPADLWRSGARYRQPVPAGEEQSGRRWRRGRRQHPADVGLLHCRHCERLANPPREVLLRQAVLELAVTACQLEGLHRGGFVALIRLERVDRILRRAEEGVDPAVVRQLVGQRLE